MVSVADTNAEREACGGTSLKMLNLYPCSSITISSNMMTGYTVQKQCKLWDDTLRVVASVEPVVPEPPWQRRGKGVGATSRGPIAPTHHSHHDAHTIRTHPWPSGVLHS